MNLTKDITNIDITEWLKLNAALQKKKNALRKEIAKRGVFKKGGKNNFDKYTYFSEAQYKEIFTQFFSDNGLELTTTEISNSDYPGSEKMPFGRKATLCFRLTDIETGFFEESLITGDAIDKGDKGLYKAYTGALKYYLANTFMVATGDDPEKDSNDTKPLKKDADYYVCDTCGVSTFGTNKRTAAELKKSSIDKFGMSLCPKCAQAKLDEVTKAELAKIEAEQTAESAENAESEAKNGKIYD